jgi:uncharacterized protein (TIGR03437 family)
LSDASFGGSGNDSMRGVAVDASGNIYVVGTTFSFDLPLLNPFQAVNSGTQLIYSTDAGATWKPLSNPFASSTPSALAVDPTISSTLYVAAGNTACKSIDGGQHFHCVALAFASPQTSITSLAIDPRQPATLYASATTLGGVFKSIDGGQTWINSSSGLPSNGFIDSVTIDPFHPNILYAWAGRGGYVSLDGAGSWTPSSLPWPAGTGVGGGVHFSFDPVTPGTIYGPGFVSNTLTVQKSTDGGQSWTQLSPPFSGCCVVPDPKLPGVLYTIAAPASGGPVAFWKSQDGGSTWASTTLPAGAIGAIAVDPSDPRIIVAGGFRSTDGGNTFTTTNASRSIQAVFSPSAPNTVYATAPITSDAFVAKFLPDGKTLVFATYFGGMGNEVGNSIALDAGGNIWIAGTTSSVDLPVTPGAFQSTLKGSGNGFIAKLSNDGKLLAASYLGGSKQDATLGMAISPQGNPWLIGSWSSADFPLTTGSPAVPQQGLTDGVLSELDSSLAQLLFSTPVDGFFDVNGKGIAIDPLGNVTVTGSTYDAGFPVTAGVFHTGPPSRSIPKAFVLKTDSSGNSIYSTYFGGSQATGTAQFPEGPHDNGIAVAVDGNGNAYIAGNTSSSDFPATAGAFQNTIAHSCTYPTFTINTGTIGTIADFFIDDSFVVKLSPDGKAIYSTFLGGACYDLPTSIAVDTSGNVYVTGETDSQDYPLVSAVEGVPTLRLFASFVSALNPAGSALTFSTYLYAGAKPSVAAGSDGSIYVAGSTGLGAQTFPDSGFINPFPLTATDGYLAILRPPASAPLLSLTQVANAFSLVGGAVAPGEIVSLSVPGFVPAQPADIGLNVLAPLTTNLAGVQVSFDGRLAYVMSLSSNRIECIAPVEIAGQRSTALQVNINGASSNVLNVNVAPTALGLLSSDGSGAGLANARNFDGTLNSASNPAPLGSIVTLFLTGVGLTKPPEADGVPPRNSDIVPVASISSFFPVQGTLHALAGFVPGLFAYALPIPNDPRLASRITIVLSTDSSQSQNLFVYTR